MYSYRCQSHEDGEQKNSEDKCVHLLSFRLIDLIDYCTEYQPYLYPFYIRIKTETASNRDLIIGQTCRFDN